MKKILIVLGLLAIAFVTLGLLLPSQWKVQRSIVIEAPATAIFPLVANLKQGWPQWSTFDTEDPSTVYSYSGTEEGKGAERSWESKKMGNGSQKIVQASPEAGVDFTLMMQNGFHIDGKIAFEQAGSATKVTWADSGNVGAHIFFRYMVLFMDKMMGPMFEKSLETLKQKAEAGAH